MMQQAIRSVRGLVFLGTLALVVTINSEPSATGSRELVPPPDAAQSTPAPRPSDATAVAVDAFGEEAARVRDKIQRVEVLIEERLARGQAPRVPQPAVAAPAPIGRDADLRAPYLVPRGKSETLP